MLYQRGRALHDVREAGEDEPPARDERDGVGEARAEAEVQVLHEHLLERLQSIMNFLNVNQWAACVCVSRHPALTLLIKSREAASAAEDSVAGSQLVAFLGAASIKRRRRRP